MIEEIFQICSLHVLCCICSFHFRGNSIIKSHVSFADTLDRSFSLMLHIMNGGLFLLVQTKKRKWREEKLIAQLEKKQAKLEEEELQKKARKEEEEKCKNLGEPLILLRNSPIYIVSSFAYLQDSFIIHRKTIYGQHCSAWFHSGQCTIT